MKEHDPLSFYRATITPEYVTELLQAAKIAPRAGIFSATTVVWLMIAQRMGENDTLSAAVESLRLRRERELLEDSSGSCRARAGRIASGTSGYSQARKRIPITVVEQIADRLNETILTYRRKQSRSVKDDVYVIDGSTIRVAHTPDNLAEYPQHTNQHGESHYPLIRIAVATHADTGIITRPSFGPYNGPNAVSEHELAKGVLSQLPEGATVIGDRLYGCFRFAHIANSLNLKVVCRMKESNAKAMLKFAPTGIGEQTVVWTPSAHDQKRNPEMCDEKVQGRLVWCPLSEGRKTKEMLVIFTTTDLPLKSVIALYGRRWLVETDLRNLKATLKMNFIDAKSPAMISKEIILGSCAYNLLCYMMSTAAAREKMSARQLSFTAVLRRIHSIASISIAVSYTHLTLPTSDLV